MISHSQGTKGRGGEISQNSVCHLPFSLFYKSRGALVCFYASLECGRTDSEVWNNFCSSTYPCFVAGSTQRGRGAKLPSNIQKLWKWIASYSQQMMSRRRNIKKQINFSPFGFSWKHSSLDNNHKILLQDLKKVYLSVAPYPLKEMWSWKFWNPETIDVGYQKIQLPEFPSIAGESALASETAQKITALFQLG